MFKLLWKKKALFLFLAVLICTLPYAVKKPAQMTQKAILTEITIDKSGDAIELRGQMLDIKKESVPVSASAPTLKECISKISKLQEKKVSFAHCKDITIGENLKDEYIPDILEYFLLLPELSNNCNLSYIEKGKRATLEQFFKDTLAGRDAIIAKGKLQQAVFKAGKFAYIVDIVLEK
jgi:hypothetical protein